MNRYITLLALVILCSCKTGQSVATTTKAADTKTESSKIILGHYAVPRNFTTAYIKAGVRYEDAKNKQNVSAEIRIKKDEIILVSVRLLGITMAKALITPTQVKYYEKLNGKYFEGDYEMLSRWLGTDLDFQKVQNLLIGQAMDNLKDGSYQTTTQGNLYQLESKGSIIRLFQFEPDHFWLKKQRIEQPAQNRSVEISYPDYAQYGGTIFPKQLLISALQPKGKTTIDVDINAVDVDQPLTFPYSVPGGYEKIDIND
jgi:hypothetical protein